MVKSPGKHNPCFYHGTGMASIWVDPGLRIIYIYEGELVMEDLKYILILVGIAVFFIVMIVWEASKEKKYMKAQQENGTDKREMLDLMAQVMDAEYANYSYVVGRYTKTIQHGRTTTYYYFPYILAFNSEGLIIFPFIKKEGKLYIRNRLAVDWNVTEFKHVIRKKGMTLTFKIVGEVMPINVDPVIKSLGEEKSERPIGVYQEQEYQQLQSYLDIYRSRAKK